MSLSNKNLYIFESINKANFFSKLMNIPSDNVAWTNGHVLTMDTKNYGFNIDENGNIHIASTFLKGKLALVKDIIKKATNKDNIYLLFDADLEGEKQAFDIYSILLKNNIKCNILRGYIKAYTKTDLKKSFNNIIVYNKDNINKYKIDKILRIQKLRRLLDRIIGFAITSDILFDGFLDGTGRAQLALITAMKNIKVLSIKNSSFYKPIIPYFDKYDQLNINSRYSRGYSLGTLKDILCSSHNPRVAYTYLQKMYENGVITYPRTDNNQMSGEYASFLGVNKDNIDKKYLVDSSFSDGFLPHEGIRFTFDFLDYIDSLSKEEQDTYFAEIFDNITSNMSYKYENVFFDILNDISLYSLRNKYEKIFHIDASIETDNISFENTLYTHDVNIQVSDPENRRVDFCSSENEMVFLMSALKTATPATYTYVMNKLIEKQLVAKIRDNYVFTVKGNEFYDFVKNKYNLNLFLSNKYKEVIVDGVDKNKLDIEVLKDLMDLYNMNLYIKDNKIYSATIKEEKFDFDLNFLGKNKILSENTLSLMI